MSEKGLTVEFKVPSSSRRKKKPEAPTEPVPRIARLLALAWKWELAVRNGEVKDYAEIARLMGLSRARVTQICKLVLLSPVRQEEILDSRSGTSRLAEHRIRNIPAEVHWRQ